MADWTNIPNESLEPDAPVRSIDGLAFRDNPIAIAEGAAGAPRIPQLTANDTFFVSGNEWNDVPANATRTLFNVSGAHILVGGTLTGGFVGPGFNLTVDGVTFTYNGQGLANGTQQATSLPSARCSSSMTLELINLRPLEDDIKGAAYLMEI